VVRWFFAVQIPRLFLYPTGLRTQNERFTENVLRERLYRDRTQQVEGENRMRDRSKLNTRSLFLFAAFTAGISLFIWLAGCSPPQPEQPPGPRRYSLQGRVVSVEKEKQQVVVDHGAIPGFMMAMSMGYAVKDPSLLDSLSPEDQITADVVVNGNDVWLENIVVVKKADQTKAPSSNKSHPSPAVPRKQ
jgi:Cu/Ag efflux protein CusF